MCAPTSPANRFTAGLLGFDPEQDRGHTRRLIPASSDAWRASGSANWVLWRPDPEFRAIRLLSETGSDENRPTGPDFRPAHGVDSSWFRGGYRRSKQLRACGTGVQTTFHRELFVASDVCLTGWSESLIAAVLSTPANFTNLSSDASLPQEPSPIGARRRRVRHAEAHTGSRSGGARRRSSSAGRPARDCQARDAPAPPDPSREGARCPEAGCRWGAWRSDADPCGG
jgi:hypothetical protein